MFAVSQADAEKVAAFAYLYDKVIAAEAEVAGIYFFEFATLDDDAEVADQLQIRRYNGPIRIKLKRRV